MAVTCPRCGYELTYLKEGCCSECGTALTVVQAGFAWDRVANRYLGWLGLVGFASSGLACLVVFLDAKERADIKNIVAPAIGRRSDSVWYEQLGIVGALIGLVGWIGLVGGAAVMWKAWVTNTAMRMSPADKRAVVWALIAAVTSTIAAAAWHSWLRW